MKIYKAVSLGAMILSDVAGDSYFSTDGFELSLVNSVKSKNNLFAASLQAGFYQRSFNYDELIFIQNEIAQNTNINFFDVGIGISNYKKITQKSSIIFGLSSHHLNRPTQSLTSEKKAILNTKYIFHSTYYNTINLKLDVSPAVYFSAQNQQIEFIFGSEISYMLNNEVKLISGSFIRMKDALFIILGVEKEKLQATISYDINISSLSIASNYAGAFEIAINYGWSTKKKNEKQKTIICPKYL